RQAACRSSAEPFDEWGEPEPEKGTHHVREHRSTSPRAAYTTRKAVPRLPRPGGDGQMAAAVRFHLQGPPLGCEVRRHLQDVVHALHDRQRPLLRLAPISSSYRTNASA